MLPEGFELRTQFPAGEQVKVTPAIREISEQFRGSNYPNAFRDIHDYIFNRIKILPYDESIIAYEKKKTLEINC
jgi:uncharacterized protein (DUF2461 family)